MFAVSDYQIDTYTLSNGVDVHVLLHPDEDPWVPVFQVCRASDSFKRHKRHKPQEVEYSESDMLQPVSDCNKNVITDPDRTYSVWLKKANLISFAGLAERAEHCDQEGYLAYWARLLYEVILPKYPSYTRAHDREVSQWMAATMPIVPLAPADAESVLVLMDEDRKHVLGWITHSGGPDGNWVRYMVPVSDTATVSRFLPAHCNLVGALASWIANRGGSMWELVEARVEDGQIVVQDGTLIAGTPEVDEPTREDSKPTREDSEPPREFARPLAGVPMLFEGCQCPTFGTPEDPEWIGLNVCGILGIVDHKQALARIPEEEKGVVYYTTPSPDGSHAGGLQAVKTVKEPGLYRLISESRKPEAERFKNWLYRDVLPSIRKTGSYVAPGVVSPGLTPEAFREIVRAALGQALAGQQECVAQQLSHFYSLLGDRFTRLTMDVDGWQNLAMETTHTVGELIDRVDTLTTTVDQVLDKVSARRPRFWRVKTGLRVLYGLSGKGLHAALAAIKDGDLRKKLYTANPGQVNNKLGRFCADLVQQDEQEYRRRREAGDSRARRRFLRQTRVIGGHECNVYNTAVIRHLGGLIRSGGDAPPVIPIKEA